MVWFMGVFVLCQSYSGTLISILTVPTVPVPIDSVEELVGQNKIGWGVEAGSIMEQIGATAQEGKMTVYMTK